MQSKISFFNKTLFIKNIVRFSPMQIVYLIILICYLPLTLGFELRALDFENETIESICYTLLMHFNAGVILGLSVVFSLIFAIMVFGFLFKAKSANMMHAFPLDRKTIFISSYLSGIVSLIMPQIITAIVSAIVIAPYEIAGCGICLKWALIAISYSFIMFSIATFCCMLSGHVVGAISFFAFFNIIYDAIYALYSLIVSEFVFGIDESVLFSNGFDNVFTPIAYLADKVEMAFASYDAANIRIQMAALRINGKGALAVYLIIAAVIVCASFAIYKHRRIESASDIISVKPMNPIVRTILTHVVSLLVAAIMYELYISTNGKLYYEGIMVTEQDFALFIVIFIIFSIIIFFIVEMILKKSFKIFYKKKFLEWGIVCICSVVIMLIIKGGALGVASYVPDSSDIKYAGVADQYNLSADASVELDTANIEKIIALHDTIINNAETYRDYLLENYYSDQCNIRYITIRYVLNNGKLISRTYSIPYSEEIASDDDSAYSILYTILNDKETYIRSEFGADYEQIDIKSADVTDDYYTYYDDDVDSDDSSFANMHLNATDATKLYQAYIEDIRQGDYVEKLMDVNDSDMEIYTMHFGISATYDKNIAVNSLWNTYYYDDNNGTQINKEIYVTSEFTNTINTLIELGVIDSADDLIDDVLE